MSTLRKTKTYPLLYMDIFCRMTSEQPLPKDKSRLLGAAATMFHASQKETKDSRIQAGLGSSHCWMGDQTGTKKGSRFLGGTEPQKKAAGSPEPSTLPNQAAQALQLPLLLQRAWEEEVKPEETWLTLRIWNDETLDAWTRKYDEKEAEWWCRSLLSSNWKRPLTRKWLASAMI